MVEPIVFVLAHVVLGLLGRLVFTGFDGKKVFLDELKTTGLVCLAAVAIGVVLYLLFPVR